MAGRPLKVIGKILLNDGNIKPIDDLSEAELTRVNKSMSERLSRRMSEYFHNNREEYEILSKEC